MTLLIATRNSHKVFEIGAILGEGFRCLSLSDYSNRPTVLEDAPTFAGNATKKAVELARWARRSGFQISNLEFQTSISFVLADDSGLEVDALDGAPGVHSARFAAGKGEGNAPSDDNNAKLLRLLEKVPSNQRIARFRCVLALTPICQPGSETASPVCYADEAELQTELFVGVCEGRIALAPRGRGGFGYDPLFIPEGYDQTFGELSEEVKNRLSHRAEALDKLKRRLTSPRGFA